MNRCRDVFRCLLTLTLLTSLLAAPARASHETIVVDGDLTDLINAVNNNLGGSEGGFAGPNALGNIYSPSCAFVNGFDIRNNYVLFDFKNAGGDFTPNDITLYLGWEVEGVIGDVDGDNNDSTYTAIANFTCANNGDQRGIGQFEAYKTFIDLDCDFTPDIIICIQNNAVLLQATGNPIPGATFARNGKFLEVRVPDFQNLLPAGNGLCEANVILTANSQFDGLGEDSSPRFELRVDPQVELTKTPSVQDACAGQNVSWTIEVTNTGLCPLQQVVVHDTLSAGMTFVSSNPPSTGDAQNRTWTFKNVAPGDVISIELTANITAQCQTETHTNKVALEGLHDSNCAKGGVTATAMATVNCRNTPCDVSGDTHVCVGNTKTYTTTVGAPFLRTWSVTSSPAGICNITGPTDGASVQVNFTGAGTCTVSLLVKDPLDPDACQKTCSQIVLVDPQPPCDIDGDQNVCVGNRKTYSTTVNGVIDNAGEDFGRPEAFGVGYLLSWSVTSTPGGICSINGPTDGSSIDVDFTGAGTCTVSLTVTDPNDPTDCVTTCTRIVTVNPQPPCDIDGDQHACVGNTKTYTTTAGAQYTRTWSVTSTPAGICNIVGGNTGGSINVNYTGAGVCTVSLTVSDPNDPTDCVTTCTRIVNVDLQPPCNIDGDRLVCVGTTKTYTTTVGAEYTRTWSVTSNPGGICAVSGGNTGGSVNVNFTGAGTCTVTLTVTDPNDPVDCRTVCSLVVTSNAVATCSISGPDNVCSGATDLIYSVITDPADAPVNWEISGNASIVGPTTGPSVSVTAGDGGGSFTLKVTVSSGECSNTCELSRTLIDCTPNTCWMTGGGCLNEGSKKGQKNHTFGGNVGPPPSGSWEHIVRSGNKIEFNFHSWDSKVDSCWADDGAGPCSPRTDVQNIIWSGTGRYSMGSGQREYNGTFRAYVQDRKEGSCGTKDYYEITVFDAGGGIVFHVGQPIDCGNLQLHKPTGSMRSSDIITTPLAVPSEPGMIFTAVPNPFRTSTRILYSVGGESSQPVSVGVYDVSGRLVRRIDDGFRFPGDYEAVWDGRSDEGETVTSGIYFVRVVAGTSQAVTRVMFAN